MRSAAWVASFSRPHLERSRIYREAGTGLLCFAVLMIGSVMLLLEFGVQWKSTWPVNALNRTMVFSYRNFRPANLPESGLSCEAVDVAE